MMITHRKLGVHLQIDALDIFELTLQGTDQGLHSANNHHCHCCRRRCHHHLPLCHHHNGITMEKMSPVVIIDHLHHHHHLFLRSVHCKLFYVLFHQTLCVILAFELFFCLLSLDIGRD